MAYQKYKDIPNRREPLAGRDHIQHIETGLGRVVDMIDSGEIGGDPNAVLGAGVRRIIASHDPDYPLEDGDLLVLIETDQNYTDFSFDATGTMPSGWSAPGVAFASVEVVEDADATGGKLLRLVTSGTNSQHVLAWSGGPGTVTDVTMRWRVPGSGGGASSATVRPAVSVSGSSATSNLCLAWGGNDAAAGVYLGQIFNGTTPSPFGREATPTATGTAWYHTRVQREGDTVRMRMWLGSDSEPSVWHTEGTLPTAGMAQGVAGLYIFTGNRTVEIDWVRVEG